MASHAAASGKPWPRVPPYPFPRSEQKRTARMQRFVEWKREKIAERRWRHLGLFMLWCCAPPIALVVIGMCWRLLLWVSVS